MKLSEAPTKIVGVQVGEVDLNIMLPGKPFVTAKIALLTDDNGPTGFVNLSDGLLSKETLKAAESFIAALEDDALKVLFKMTEQSSENKEGSENEPAQF